MQPLYAIVLEGHIIKLKDQYFFQVNRGLNQSRYFLIDVVNGEDQEKTNKKIEWNPYRNLPVRLHAEFISAESIKVSEIEKVYAPWETPRFENITALDRPIIKDKK